MDWFRWYHGTTTDAKWRVVARRSGRPVNVVVSVWASFMERASEGAKRGHIDGWDAETIGAALEIEAEDVRAVHAAMQGKVLDGDRLTGWPKRQPKREDPGAVDRMRALRERRRDAENGDGYAALRRVTQCSPEEREERDPKKKPPTGAKKKGTAIPDAWSPNEVHARIAAERRLDLSGEEEKFRDWAVAKGTTYKDWDAAFRNWLRNDRYRGAGGRMGMGPSSQANGRKPTRLQDCTTSEEVRALLAKVLEGIRQDDPGFPGSEPPSAVFDLPRRFYREWNEVLAAAGLKLI